MDTTVALDFPKLDQSLFPPLPVQASFEIPDGLKPDERDMMIAANCLLLACINAKAWRAVSSFEFMEVMIGKEFDEDRQNTALRGLGLLVKSNCLSRTMHMSEGKNGKRPWPHYTPEVPLLMLLGLLPPLPLTLPASVVQHQS